MKTKNIFEKLKKEYQETTPRKPFRQEGWSGLKLLLDKQEERKLWESSVHRWIMVSTLMFFISTTAVFTVATKAKPGEILYSVKQFSEQFESLITPKPTIVKELPEIKKPTEQTQPTHTNSTASKSGEKDDQNKNSTIKKENYPVTPTPTKVIEIKKTAESIKPEDKKENTKKDETKSENKKTDDHNEKSAEHVEEKVKDAVSNTLDGLLK